MDLVSAPLYHVEPPFDLVRLPSDVVQLVFPFFTGC